MSSAQGRFTSVDPSRVSVKPGNPQTWNRYDYTTNNPLAYVDRNGLWPTPTHELMFDGIFGGRLSGEQIKILKQVSAAQDSLFGGGQSPNSSYKHSQCSSGQSAGQCEAMIRDYRDANVGLARQIGETTNEALTYYARAAHSDADSGSPFHTAADGTPTTWTGLARPGSWYHGVTETFLHSGDWWGLGVSIRKQVDDFHRAFPEYATRIIGTREAASQRAFEYIFNKTSGSAYWPGGEAARDAARQCGLGNPAACDWDGR